MEDFKEKEAITRIVLEENSEIYENNGLEIHYDISCGDEELVGGFDISKNNPGYFCFNQQSHLLIFIHKSVPREFVEVVFFHELKEAEFSYSGEGDPHQMAVDEEDKYVKKYFTEEQISRFKTWRNTIAKF